MSKGSGNKVVIINTLERAISDDQNRAQAFYGQHLAEVFRYLLDARSEYQNGTGATEILGVGSETPLRGSILSGLRCHPENGGTSMLIEPGIALLVDNPGHFSYESVAGLVVDPGIQILGQMTLTPGGGQTRIDVIECQRSNVVVEVDNRDMFNPITGLFAPAMINKVSTSQLVYRIRTGVPGNGFPGLVAGWMPLAVASVPSAALTWDSVTLWDVRPLVSDRWNAPFDTQLISGSLLEGRVQKRYVGTDLSTPGTLKVFGQIEGRYGSYIAGGRLGLTTTTGVGKFDVLDINNRAANFGGYTASRFWHLYAVFPFGLPRWVRYSDAVAGARVPVGTRGILAVSEIGPRFDGVPVSPVSSPAGFGLLDSPTQNAFVLVSGRTDSGSPTAPLGINADGNVVHVVNSDHYIFGNSGASGNVSSTWTLTDNVTHPGTAKALWLRLKIRMDVPAAALVTIFGETTVSGVGGGTALAECTGAPERHQATTVGTSQTIAVSQIVRVPLEHDVYNQAPGTRSFSLTWTHNVPSGDATVRAALAVDRSCELVAWED